MRSAGSFRLFSFAAITATVVACATPESSPALVPEVAIEPRPAEALPTSQRPPLATTSAPRASIEERDRAAARGLFKQGIMAFQKGDYARARSFFELAYARAPAPALLYNLAMAAQRQGDQTAACNYFAKWIKKAAPSRRRSASMRASFANCKP